MRLTAVSKRYRRRVVLDDVSIDLRAGTTTAVEGANGSGKSTLLRIVAGVSAPTLGSVAGRPSTVSYLAAGFAPPALMTAGDYVAWMGRIRGLSPAVARRRSADLLELLALLPSPAARTGSLSTGNLRKLGIAQAFVINAGLIVLDEPRSGLDSAARVVLDQLVRSASAAGSAVITADHEPTPVGSDLRLALQNGRLALADDPGMDALHYVITTTGPSGETSTLSVADHERDRRLAELLASGWSVTGVRADAER